MTSTLKPEHERIIQQEIRSGHFQSPDEVLDHNFGRLAWQGAQPQVNKTRKNLAQYLLESPLAGSELHLERQKEYVRTIDLWAGFLLDTNVLSEFNRTGEPDQQVRHWLETADTESVFASVPAVGEIRLEPAYTNSWSAATSLRANESGSMQRHVPGRTNSLLPNRPRSRRRSSLYQIGGRVAAPTYANASSKTGCTSN